MKRNKSAKIKNSAEKSSGEILPRDTEGNLMKSVAQTIIEADRFYTIAAKTGSVIQVWRASRTAATSVWASTSTSPSRSGLSSARRRRLPNPQPRLRQAHRPDDDRHRQRHLAPPVGGRGRHFPDVEDGATPAGTVRLRSMWLPASASTPWAWVLRTALCSRSGRRLSRGPAVDHLRGEGPRKARPQGGGKAR